MKPHFRSIFLVWLLAAGLMGCAASHPPQIVLRPVRTPPPDPEALGHYIDAKIFEVTGQQEAAVEALRRAVAIDTTSATLYSALARNLYVLHRRTEAVAPARRAVRLEPETSENRWLLYHALMEGPRDTVSATEQLDAIIRTDPNSLRAYDQLLKIYSAQDRRADLLRTLDRVAGMPALSAQSRLSVAENYIRNNAPERAGAIYRQALAENPRQPEVWNRLGSIALAGKDTLGAEGIFREALSHFQNRVDSNTGPIWGKLLLIYDTGPYLEGLLSSSPQDTAFVKRLADVFMSMARAEKDPKTARHRYSRAEIILDHLIRMESDRDDLLAQKAELLLATGHPQEARAEFQKAIERNPKAQYWLGIAHTHLRERDWDNAIEILQTLHGKAPADSPLYPRIVYELGRAYTERGRIAEARAVYRQAAQAAPDRPRYRFSLAGTYLSEKAWEEAIPILEALTDDADADSDLFYGALFELGRSYERAGRFEDAVRAFQRLLALDADNHQAHNYLGYMLAEKGIRLPEAEKHIAQALKAQPKNGAYLDSMGWVRYQQGRYAEAIKYLQDALKAEEAEAAKLTDDPRRRSYFYENLSVIYDHTGDAARALGDLEAARHHWERAFEYDPKNEAIQRKLQSLEGPAGGAAP